MARCKRPWISRSSSAASSPTSIRQWRIPDRRCTGRRFRVERRSPGPGSRIPNTPTRRFRWPPNRSVWSVVQIQVVKAQLAHGSDPATSPVHDVENFRKMTASPFPASCGAILHQNFITPGADHFEAVVCGNGPPGILLPWDIETLGQDSLAGGNVPPWWSTWLPRTGLLSATGDQPRWFGP